MVNTLLDIQNKILARAMPVLRKRTSLPRLVNSDFAMDATKKGASVNIELPARMTATDVTPSSTPLVGTDYVATTVALPLDKWKMTDFRMTDKDAAEVELNPTFLPPRAEAAIIALAEQVNQDIFATCYPSIYGYVGTAATTPFATTVSPAPEAFKTLNQQLAPKSERRGILDFTAEASALALAAFRDASQAGKNSVILEGEMGRFFGTDWYSDNQVPTHTAGTNSGSTTNAAGYALGIKTVTLASAGTGTHLVGDVITFAGQTQTYVITSGDADVSNGGTISFEPGLQTAIAASATAITTKATHVVNMMIQRDAIAFATRPLEDSTGEFASMQDPVTGLVMRLETVRQHKQTSWQFDILYGSKLVRPEYACRIAG